MSLQWVFEVLDRLSGPALTGARALDQLDKATKVATGDVDKLEKNLQKAGASAAVAGKGIQNFHDVLHSAQIIGNYIGRAIDFAEFVTGAIEFRQESMIGLTAVMGSASAAKGVFNDVKELAARMGTPVGELERSAIALGNVGYKAKQIHDVLVASSDLTAILGKGAGAQFETMMTKLQGSTDRGVGIQSLRMAKELIGQDYIYKALGQAFHVSAKEAELMLKNNEKLGVEIDKNTVEWAIMRALANKEGGLLGTASMKAAETLPNQLTSIKDRFLNLFDTQTAVDALKPVHDALKDIDDLLNPDKHTTADFFAVRREDWKKAWAGYAEDMKPVMDYLKLFENFFTSGHVMKDIGAQFAQMDRDITGGFGAGALGGAEDLAAKGEDLAQTFIGGVKGPRGLDAHSPSRVFEQLGKWTIEGYVRGLTVDEDLVRSTLVQTTAAASPASSGAAAARPSGTMQVHLEQHFHGSDAGDRQQLAREVKDATLSALVSAFDDLGHEGGE